LEKSDGEQPLPRYLQLLALVSFHTFIREGVEAAIFETHHGGEYDATNVIDHPVATIITSLGMDHAKQLGPSIENIAWHKSGIFKHGAQAFSAPQEAGAAKILRSRAAEKNVNIQFIADDQALPNDAPQLKPDVQRMNCALAFAAVRCLLEKKAPNELSRILPSDVQSGIEQFSWPGRFQVLSEGTFQWFLDGAHNEMSIGKAAEWFVEMSQIQM
jgi:folylpolyglutamate synthase